MKKALIFMTTPKETLHNMLEELKCNKKKRSSKNDQSANGTIIYCILLLICPPTANLMLLNCMFVTSSSSSRRRVQFCRHSFVIQSKHHRITLCSISIQGFQLIRDNDEIRFSFPDSYSLTLSLSLYK